MKIKNGIKKVGAAAGSALMVGMTMGAAASLADFPQPFVKQDGTVASQIVVGSQGKQADVVGAINVAAALGQKAIKTQTKTVSASGSSFGWSASKGETLDTRNDKLYFGDQLDTVRETLTEDHLSALADTTFQDDSGDEYDVEYFLYPGNKALSFGQPSDADNQDPFLYVDNPADPNAQTNGDNLYSVQANFQDTLNVTDADVRGEEITLFGTEYTISEDSTASELILFGSSKTVSLSTSGQSSGTVTVNGNEHTITIQAVNDNGVVYSVDGGSFEQDTEGTEFTIEDQTVRIDNVINLNDDAGSADFEIGSNELHMQDGQAIEDSDGDDIDGTYVQVNGGAGSTDFGGLNSLTIGIGSHNDDAEYVKAGEAYSHPQFGNFEFHFGGLNPDASQGASDSVGKVEFSTSGDDTATVSFTDDAGDSTSVEFAHEASTDDGTQDISLADQDGQAIKVTEGTDVSENEFVMTDAGDFSHMWEVTGIDRDDSDGTLDASDEATVTLSSVVGGSSIEVDLDANTTGNVYQGDEVVDGQSLYVQLEGGNNVFGDAATNELRIAWGNGAAAGPSFTTGMQTTVYPPLDLKSGSALALTKSVSGLDVNATLTLPSTQSTDAKRQDLDDLTDKQNQTFSASGSGLVFRVDAPANPTPSDTVSLDVDRDADGTTPGDLGPSALVIEPEDDGDQEDAFHVEPGTDTSNDQLEVGGGSGFVAYTDGLQRTALESNDDVNVDYTSYGTYFWEDTNEQGSVTLQIPDGQAVAGAAYTDPAGDLSAGGSGGGTVEYTAMTGMGQLPDMGMLDSEVTDSVKQSKHLILVGGPAVNTLVSDLAAENQNVWTQQGWIDKGSGTARLNLVENAFAQGQHALVVAGYGASDTRAAARYLSNYPEHQDQFQGKKRLTLTSADYPSSGSGS